MGKTVNINKESLSFDVTIPENTVMDVSESILDLSKDQHKEIYELIRSCAWGLEDAVKSITEYLNHIGETFEEIDIKMSDATKGLSSSNVNDISGDQR